MPGGWCNFNSWPSILPRASDHVTSSVCHRTVMMTVPMLSVIIIEANLNYKIYIDQFRIFVNMSKRSIWFSLCILMFFTSINFIQFACDTSQINIICVFRFTRFYPCGNLKSWINPVTSVTIIPYISTVFLNKIY